MAKEKAVKKEAKKEKVEYSKEQLDNFKNSVRAKIKPYDEAKINALAKKMGVDTAKYKALAGGLKRMSINNSIIGSAVALAKDGQSFNVVLKSL